MSLLNDDQCFLQRSSFKRRAAHTLCRKFSWFNISRPEIIHIIHDEVVNYDPSPSDVLLRTSTSAEQPEMNERMFCGKTYITSRGPFIETAEKKSTQLEIENGTVKLSREGTSESPRNLTQVEKTQQAQPGNILSGNLLRASSKAASRVDWSDVDFSAYYYPSVRESPIRQTKIDEVRYEGEPPSMCFTATNFEEIRRREAEVDLLAGKERTVSKSVSQSEYVDQATKQVITLQHAPNTRVNTNEFPRDTGEAGSVNYIFPRTDQRYSSNADTHLPSQHTQTGLHCPNDVSYDASTISVNDTELRANSVTCVAKFGYFDFNDVPNTNLSKLSDRCNCAPIHPIDIPVVCSQLDTARSQSARSTGRSALRLSEGNIIYSSTHDHATCTPEQPVKRVFRKQPVNNAVSSRANGDTNANKNVSTAVSSGVFIECSVQDKATLQINCLLHSHTDDLPCVHSGDKGYIEVGDSLSNDGKQGNESDTEITLAKMTEKNLCPSSGKQVIIGKAKCVSLYGGRNSDGNVKSGVLTARASRPAVIGNIANGNEHGKKGAVKCKCRQRSAEISLSKLKRTKTCMNNNCSLSEYADQFGVDGKTGRPKICGEHDRTHTSRKSPSCETGGHNQAASLCPNKLVRTGQTTGMTCQDTIMSKQLPRKTDADHVQLVKTRRIKSGVQKMPRCGVVVEPAWHQLGSAYSCSSPSTLSAGQAIAQPRKESLHSNASPAKANRHNPLGRKSAQASPVPALLTTNTRACLTTSQKKMSSKCESSDVSGKLLVNPKQKIEPRYCSGTTVASRNRSVCNSKNVVNDCVSDTNTKLGIVKYQTNSSVRNSKLNSKKSASIPVRVSKRSSRETEAACQNSDLSALSSSAEDSRTSNSIGDKRNDVTIKETGTLAVMENMSDSTKSELLKIQHSSDSDLLLAESVRAMGSEGHIKSVSGAASGKETEIKSCTNDKTKRKTVHEQSSNSELRGNDFFVACDDRISTDGGTAEEQNRITSCATQENIDGSRESFIKSTQRSDSIPSTLATSTNYSQRRIADCNENNSRETRADKYDDSMTIKINSVFSNVTDIIWTKPSVDRRGHLRPTTPSSVPTLNTDACKPTSGIVRHIQLSTRQSTKLDKSTETSENSDLTQKMETKSSINPPSTKVRTPSATSNTADCVADPTFISTCEDAVSNEETLIQIGVVGRERKVPEKVISCSGVQMTNDLVTATDNCAILREDLDISQTPSLPQLGVQSDVNIASSKAPRSDNPVTQPNAQLFNAGKVNGAIHRPTVGSVISNQEQINCSEVSRLYNIHNDDNDDRKAIDTTFIKQNKSRREQVLGYNQLGIFNKKKKKQVSKVDVMNNSLHHTHDSKTTDNSDDSSTLLCENRDIFHGKRTNDTVCDTNAIITAPETVDVDTVKVNSVVWNSQLFALNKQTQLNVAEESIPNVERYSICFLPSQRTQLIPNSVEVGQILNILDLDVESETATIDQRHSVKVKEQTTCEIASEIGNSITLDSCTPYLTGQMYNYLPRSEVVSERIVKQCDLPTNEKPQNTSQLHTESESDKMHPAYCDKTKPGIKEKHKITSNLPSISESISVKHHRNMHCDQPELVSSTSTATKQKNESEKLTQDDYCINIENPPLRSQSSGKFKSKSIPDECMTLKKNLNEVDYQSFEKVKDSESQTKRSPTRKASLLVSKIARRIHACSKDNDKARLISLGNDNPACGDQRNEEKLIRDDNTLKNTHKKSNTPTDLALDYCSTSRKKYSVTFDPNKCTSPSDHSLCYGGHAGHTTVKNELDRLDKDGSNTLVTGKHGASIVRSSEETYLCNAVTTGTQNTTVDMNLEKRDQAQQQYSASVSTSSTTTAIANDTACYTSFDACSARKCELSINGDTDSNIFLASSSICTARLDRRQSGGVSNNAGMSPEPKNTTENIGDANNYSEVVVESVCNGTREVGTCHNAFSLSNCSEISGFNVDGFCDSFSESLSTADQHSSANIVRVDTADKNPEIQSSQDAAEDYEICRQTLCHEAIECYEHDCDVNVESSAEAVNIPRCQELHGKNDEGIAGAAPNNNLDIQYTQATSSQSPKRGIASRFNPKDDLNPSPICSVICSEHDGVDRVSGRYTDAQLRKIRNDGKSLLEQRSRVPKGIVEETVQVLSTHLAGISQPCSGVQRSGHSQKPTTSSDSKVRFLKERFEKQSLEDMKAPRCRVKYNAQKNNCGRMKENSLSGYKVETGDTGYYSPPSIMSTLTDSSGFPTAVDTLSKDMTLEPQVHTAAPRGSEQHMEPPSLTVQAKADTLLNINYSKTVNDIMSVVSGTKLTDDFIFGGGATSEMKDCGLSMSTCQNLNLAQNSVSVLSLTELPENSESSMDNFSERTDKVESTEMVVVTRQIDSIDNNEAGVIMFQPKIFPTDSSGDSDCGPYTLVDQSRTLDEVFFDTVNTSSLAPEVVLVDGNFNPTGLDIAHCSRPQICRKEIPVSTIHGKQLVDPDSVEMRVKHRPKEFENCDIASAERQNNPPNYGADLPNTKVSPADKRKGVFWNSSNFGSSNSWTSVVVCDKPLSENSSDGVASVMNAESKEETIKISQVSQCKVQQRESKTNNSIEGEKFSKTVEQGLHVGDDCHRPGHSAPHAPRSSVVDSANIDHSPQHQFRDLRIKTDQPSSPDQVGSNKRRKRVSRSPARVFKSPSRILVSQPRTRKDSSDRPSEHIQTYADDHFGLTEPSMDVATFSLASVIPTSCESSNVTTNLVASRLPSSNRSVNAKPSPPAVNESPARDVPTRLIDYHLAWTKCTLSVSPERREAEKLYAKALAELSYEQNGQVEEDERNGNGGPAVSPSLPSPYLESPRTRLQRSISLPTANLYPGHVKVSYIDGHFSAAATDSTETGSSPLPLMTPQLVLTIDREDVEETDVDRMGHSPHLTSQENMPNFIRGTRHWDASFANNEPLSSRPTSYRNAVLDSNVLPPADDFWSPFDGPVHHVVLPRQQSMVNIPLNCPIDSDEEENVDKYHTIGRCQSTEIPKLQRNPSFYAAQKKGTISLCSSSSSDVSSPIQEELSLEENVFASSSSLDQKSKDSTSVKSPGLFKRMLQRHRSFSDRDKDKRDILNTSASSTSKEQSYFKFPALKSILRRGSKDLMKLAEETSNEHAPLAKFQNSSDIDSVPSSPYASSRKLRRSLTTGELTGLHTRMEKRSSLSEHFPVVKYNSFMRAELGGENSGNVQSQSVSTSGSGSPHPPIPSRDKAYARGNSLTVNFTDQSHTEEYSDDHCIAFFSGRVSDSVNVGTSVADLPNVINSTCSSCTGNDCAIEKNSSAHSSQETLDKDCPKSDMPVQWEVVKDSHEEEMVKPMVRRCQRGERSNSDLGDLTTLTKAVQQFNQLAKMQHSISMRSIRRKKFLEGECGGKSRRMSTPHPIKSRHEKSRPEHSKRAPLHRSLSMPENLDRLRRRKRITSFFGFDQSGNYCSPDQYSDDSSDEFENSMERSKYHTTRASHMTLASISEKPYEECLTYAEALWDHVTMDPEELAFRAGDLIEVTDTSDKDWWWGAIQEHEGWFPAAFVRLRANQGEFASDESEELAQPLDDVAMKTVRVITPEVSRRLGSTSGVSREQARTNVVNEILQAEREYVKHLHDVIQGYIRQARRHPDMFSEERITIIFGNLEEIFEVSTKFMADLEKAHNPNLPHLTEIGQCFLRKRKQFEIYSDYCNNHPEACKELEELYRNKRYRHFFEACRLLQDMVQIPLEGFLLNPVQKICKYPLQLSELLKFTDPDHSDHGNVREALEAMKRIASFINERKRKMESIAKIAAWQQTVEDWQGPDLLQSSSELIYSCEAHKVNRSGRVQERTLFLFDHQLIYCKKDLLRRNGYCYKGRISMDQCQITTLPDGKDLQYNVNVKNGWKLHNQSEEKWLLFCTKSSVERNRWLQAHADERQQVLQDQENDFTIPHKLDHSTLKMRAQPDKPKATHLARRLANAPYSYQKELLRKLPATLPQSLGQGHAKKRGWFNFISKKMKT